MRVEIKDIETKYCGIYIRLENKKYWLIGGNCSDSYFDSSYPTLQDIENFKNDLLAIN